MKQKIVVKVFLPKINPTTNSTKYLSGEFKCETNCESGCRQIFVFITSIQSDRVASVSPARKIVREISTKNYRKTDQRSNDDSNDYIWLEYDFETPETVKLKKINLPIAAADPENLFKVQIILYDPKTFTKLCKNDDTNPQKKSVAVLAPIAYLVKLLRQSEAAIDSPVIWCRRLREFLCFLLLNVNRTPLQTILRKNESAFLRHFSIWLESITYFTFQSGRAWTIVFDVVSGMLVMLVLLCISDPGEYLLKCTELIVRQLQQLLESLKGSPVGFKLNIELNNFFLTCFRYHVDLWALFLVIIAPLIKYLFAPLAILGCMGLSFQLAMLSDLLSIITLHAHCIYIYAAILYRIEVVGLLALWRVVSGRRKNILN